MRIPHHLVRSPSGRWSFRQRVPKDLQAKLAQRQRVIKRTLRTTELRQAQVQAIGLAASYAQVFNAVRGLPIFQFLPEIGKVIYTTNAIESLNMVMRKYTRNRRIFPNDESALKSLFLAISEASKNWKAIHHRKPALQSFQVMFGEERVPLQAL